MIRFGFQIYKFFRFEAERQAQGRFTPREFSLRLGGIARRCGSWNGRGS
jgi:hypothetical protein